MLSNLISFVTGGWRWIVALAIVAGLTFSAGFYAGSSHTTKIFASQVATASDKARTEQKKQDAIDWARAKADTDKRAKEQQAANVALNELLAKKPKIIVKHVTDPSSGAPDIQIPVISKDSMASLNDPSLVGDTQ